MDNVICALPHKLEDVLVERPAERVEYKGLDSRELSPAAHIGVTCQSASATMLALARRPIRHKPRAMP